MKQIIDALAAEGVTITLRDGEVRAVGQTQVVSKWLSVLREHRPEIIRWLEGRRVLEEFAKTLGHPLDDLIDWYAADIAEFADMERNDAEHVVRDYIANYRLYRNSGG